MSPVSYSTPCRARLHVDEHRARYRKRTARPDARPPDEDPRQPPSAAGGAGDASVSSPPSAASRAVQERPAHVVAAAARWQRITELNARLTAQLDGENRALWLALEEALHVHWLDVAVDHYHRGYEAGRAQSWLDAALADETSPQDKLRVLSAALAEVVDRLLRAPPGGAS